MQALQVDWDLIRELYNKGMPLRQIEQQTGVQQSTISSRATRAGWKQAATKANTIMQAGKTEVVVNRDEPEQQALSKASSLVRGKLADELLRAVDTLTGTKPSKRLESQSRRASVVQTLAGAAKVIHGWSEGQSSPAVRISIMDSTVVLEEKQTPVNANVIDIASTPVLESKSSESDPKPQ